jgi:8-oxo-dGTP diphosphatase
VRIRGVDIEVLQADAAAVGAAGLVVEEGAVLPAGPEAGEAVLRVSAAGPGGIADEETVRAAWMLCLSEAGRLGLSSVAVPALGAGAGGLTPVAAGKIAAQEIIRLARGRPAGLSAVRVCCRDPGVFAAYEKAVVGYLTHFLDVLLWGPFVVVDAIIEVPHGKGTAIVLVRRSNPPFGHALPGGFVDYGESLEEAVKREAFEETGLALEGMRQMHTYSDPARDPRFHTITTVFVARGKGTPTAGDDAAAVRVVSREEIRGLSFAFDHGVILADYLGGM